jgi:hypothetical protein
MPILLILAALSLVVWITPTPARASDAGKWLAILSYAGWVAGRVF